METKKGKSINAENYVGHKTRIAYAKLEEMKFGAVIKVMSEVIPFQSDDELPEGKELRASILFSVAKDEDEKYFIFEGSRLDKFLQKKGIRITNDYNLGDTITELVGVQCVVQQNNDGYLELA